MSRAGAAPARSLERLISLDAYRQRRHVPDSASVALSRLESLRPALPVSFVDDHRIAFLAASEHHGARALCLLLNSRAIPAALHHLTALLFRHYASGDAITRISCIWAHLGGTNANVHAVHGNTTAFFRATVEKFFREYSKEVNGDAGRFSVVDEAGSVISLFFHLGYERRYNATLETYNASLRRNGTSERHVLERNNAPIANR